MQKQLKKSVRQTTKGNVRIHMRIVFKNSVLTGRKPHIIFHWKHTRLLKTHIQFGNGNVHSVFMWLPIIIGHYYILLFPFHLSFITSSNNKINNANEWIKRREWEIEKITMFWIRFDMWFFIINKKKFTSLCRLRLCVKAHFLIPLSLSSHYIEFTKILFLMANVCVT